MLSLAEFESADTKKIQYKFSGDMRLGKITFRTANVENGRPEGRPFYALQQSAAYSNAKLALHLTHSSSTCFATRFSLWYILRSLGFSILPVGLRGTSAKMIFLGRL